MKKIFTILSLVLMVSSAFGSDVLFKMVVTTTSNVAADAGNDVDLASYYHFYVGGSALVHNGQGSSATVVQSGIARITNNEGYLQITLPAGVNLQTGDVIQYVGEATEASNNRKIILHKLGGNSAGGRSGGVSVDHNTAYTVKNSDVINGEHVIYINLGGSMNVNYIKNFTITRPNADVLFYSFDEEEVRDFETTDKVDLGNGLEVNSDGSSTYNGIKAVSGKPNALFLKGKNANRAAELTVSGPCKVEIWGWATNATYYLGINAGSYAAPTESNKMLSLTEANVITKGEYKNNSFGEKVLYITPTGGFYIAAIRVTYKSSDVHVITANNCTMSGGESANGILWTSTTGNHLTFANENPSTTNPIAKTTDGANFTIVASRGLRLASSKTYTVSVPSNQVIVAAYVEAYSHGSATNAKINVNGAGMSAELPNHNSGSAPTKIYATINASSFTIVTNSTNSLVEIEVLTEEMGYYPVTVSHGWASFCAPEDVEIPAGLTAYVGESVSAGELALTEIEGNMIPANTGVVLAGEDGAYEMVSATGAAAVASSFAGTVKRIANPDAESTYTLWYDNDADEVVLAKYTGSYIPANKAYLSYVSAGAPQRIRMVAGPKMPTDVETVTGDGLQVTEKVIENGQLVIIKNGVRYNAVGQVIR